MNFNSLIGNEHIKKTLLKPFHAYLIEGETGSGRHTLLRLLAASCVCTADDERKPCMKCVQCRKFLSGNHPDVTYVSADIKVEALREVLADVSYKPNEADRKCIIIDGAEKLSVQAQNILLKTLEEPPQYVVFILVCATKEGLLETVRSRCMTLSMRPLTYEQIDKALEQEKYKDCDAEKKREAKAFCDGYLGKAESIMFAQAESIYGLCKKFAAALIKGDAPALFDICSFKKREELADFTELLQKYFGEHLRALLLKNRDPFDKDTANMGEKRLTALCSKLADISRAIPSNVNVSLWSVRLVRDCLAAYSCEK